VVPKPLFAAALVIRRQGRCPRCRAGTWSWRPGRCRGAQVLDRGAQAVARAAARCASQVLGRGAQAVALGAATMSRQEKNNSANAQRCRVNINGFIYAVVR
jgi:Asp/Glu/hydantoin racemase